ncbi:MAG: hypothetical protein SOY27_03230 [Fournierella sp.]|uniref:anti-sigma-I factor RsgI family protein n=1 Tax=Allofournierella sp. TaxID=1940256 RepID=UPI002A825966|nr:hypothetical protein [Fournierella sp.]MDY4166486.1 hypothetical protein [Fournierella sp.]
MKYLVMEARPSYAILLDEEGRFVRAANLHYEPGQTVEHIVPMRTRAPKSKGVLIWLPGVLAAACLVLMAAVLLRAPITPYASVYLTINPQVRIDVDRQSVARGLEGVNPDGQALVEGYDWKGKHLDQVTDELIDRAVDMGYLAPGGAITIDLEAEDEDWVVQTNQALQAHLEEYLQYQNLRVTVQVGQSVSIPVAPAATAAPTAVLSPAPNDSGYGDSAYGTPAATTAPQAGDSGYGEEGDSGYGTAPTAAPAPAPETGDSGYGDSGQAAAPTAAPVPAATPVPATPVPQGGDSGYDAPQQGDSGYDQPDQPEQDSGYDGDD